MNGWICVGLSAVCRGIGLSCQLGIGGFVLFCQLCVGGIAFVLSAINRWICVVCRGIALSCQL
jgi:hypothetical protein